jgi:hypothetical protein
MNEVEVNIHIGKDNFQNIVDRDIFRLIDPVWNGVNIYETKEILDKDLSKFSVPQKNAFVVYFFDSEVQNGGFGQCYSNSTGILWKYALDAFKAIGCQAAYDILMKTVDYFGGDIPFDRKERDALLDKIYDNKDDEDECILDDLTNDYYELDDEINVAREKYILENEKDFYFDGVVMIHPTLAEFWLGTPTAKE